MTIDELILFMQYECVMSNREFIINHTKENIINKLNASVDIYDKMRSISHEIFQIMPHVMLNGPLQDNKLRINNISQMFSIDKATASDVNKTMQKIKETITNVDNDKNKKYVKYLTKSLDMIKNMNGSKTMSDNIDVIIKIFSNSSVNDNHIICPYVLQTKNEHNINQNINDEVKEKFYMKQFDGRIAKTYINMTMDETYEIIKLYNLKNNDEILTSFINDCQKENNYEYKCNLFDKYFKIMSDSLILDINIFHIENIKIY
jgi:hypothetical protein